MIDPITASLVGRGLLSVGQLALAQTIDTKRPTMQVPGAINEMVSGQRTTAGAGTDVIQQGYNTEVNQQASNAASNIARTAKSGSDAIMGVSEVAANATRAKRAGSLDFAGRSMQNKQILNQGLGILGQYQQQAWDYNENQPYQARVATKNALTQSALGNAFDTIDMNAAYGAQKQGINPTIMGTGTVTNPQQQFQQPMGYVQTPKLYQFQSGVNGSQGFPYMP
jgi:hypothetical protein